MPADIDARCQVIQDIRDRISSWQEHATVVTGRYGSGKSVAVHEALRDVRGRETTQGARRSAFGACASFPA